jgi:hypothetical protein
MKHKKQQSEMNEPVQFLTMPPKRLFVLMVASFGMYKLYWHYQNWSAIKTADGSNISPFWRVAFWIIWFYPLLKRIFSEAAKRGYKPRYSAGLLFGSYILLWVATAVLSFVVHSRWWLLAISFVGLSLTSLILLLAQQTANFGVTGSVRSGARKVSFGEVVFLLIGMQFVIGNVVVIFNSARPFTAYGSPEQKASWEDIKRLGLEYRDCTDALKERHDSLDTTDHAAVDAYEADRDKCESVKLEQTKAADAYIHSILPFYK